MAVFLSEGDFISLGKNMSKLILKLNKNNKSFKPKSDYLFIFNQDANKVIEMIKMALKIVYSYMMPILKK